MSLWQYFVGPLMAVMVAYGVAESGSSNIAPPRDPHAAHAVSSVVLLDTLKWFGSGVVIDKQSVETGCKLTVVTARHVVGTPVDQDPAGNPAWAPVNTVWFDGMIATSITMHRELDIALVIFMAPSPCKDVPQTVAHIAAMQPATLDPILHVGFPAGAPMVAYGTVIGKTRDSDLIWITSTAGPGSSGGGIFFNGQLVGILVTGEIQPPFRNRYVPIQYLYDLLPAK